MAYGKRKTRSRGRAAYGRRSGRSYYGGGRRTRSNYRPRKRSSGTRQSVQVVKLVIEQGGVSTANPPVSSAFEVPKKPDKATF